VVQSLTDGSPVDTAPMTTAQGGHAVEARGPNTAAFRPDVAGAAHIVFIDLDTVLLASHQGRRGIELGVQADLVEGIGRLAEIADQIVVLAYPPVDESSHRRPTQSRIDVVRDGLGGTMDTLLLVECPHGESSCDCAKPGSGLIELAIQRHGLPKRGGWFIGADQEGVVSGRAAGLQTVRIGPLGVDHLSTVHRADYEARDLLDAANHILMEDLASS
jgi:hypothetical protein